MEEEEPNSKFCIFLFFPFTAFRSTIFLFSYIFVRGKIGVEINIIMYRI